MLVCNYFERKTGKVVTNQDIHNIKRRFLHFSESTESKVFSLLNQFEHVDADDAEKSIEIIFLQVTAIENTSELIILDGTYKINNAMIMEDNTVPIHD